MAVIFYLWATDRNALERELAACKLDVAEIERRFTRVDDLDRAFDPSGTSGVQVNNPWSAVAAGGRGPTPIAVGYGAAFRGERDDVADFATRYGLVDAPCFGFDFEGGGSAAGGVATWQHWCPPGTFATRAQAHRLIGAEALGGARLDGAGVNVVIVDSGVSERYVTDELGATFGGGLEWTGPSRRRVPGRPDTAYTPAPRLHGDMVARNVLALAPSATIFDLPLIPERIERPWFFSLTAALAYWALDSWTRARASGPWVVVSPWAIFDRLAEAVPGNYTERRSNPLNRIVIDMTTRHDMIFSAGNSGQFCPAPRSGAYDRGPGRSILGANALEEVLCVGASRADALWVGASSQGPGPASLSRGGIDQKPDLSAPSWFRDPLDAGLADTGTSAAAAVAGGAVAALRSGWDTHAVSPGRLKSILREAARPFWHVDWNGRAGTGVIDLRATVAALEGEAAAAP